MQTVQQTTTTTTVAPKSIVVAYVLWFFLGQLGIHRFYLGRKGSAIAMLILTIIGWATVAFVVGFFLLGIVGIWLIVDIFLIPGMVRTAGASGLELFHTTTTTTTVVSSESEEMPTTVRESSDDSPTI